ncbi:hypothetical protein RHSIM_Rhsim07G0118400 [Rhododendron simsii]|uniref:Uncharacterized protein n=1 Tax=Rhododendron simsii TaxID=118357 RepID=A0A834GLW4_RHOSS|nr:hypothetical protein RHSIM_Rhsim07G0118400 [Rhododendron simsii]
MLTNILSSTLVGDTNLHSNAESPMNAAMSSIVIHTNKIPEQLCNKLTAPSSFNFWNLHKIALSCSFNAITIETRSAENWVNNMTKSTEEESGEVELEGRPLRLGLGATIPRQSRVGPLNDPVDRRLHAKLEAGKRKASQRMEEESSPPVRGGHNVKDDEDDNDDLDSRTNLFAKKRVMPLTSSLQAKKKQK